MSTLQELFPDGPRDGLPQAPIGDPASTTNHPNGQQGSPNAGSVNVGSLPAPAGNTPSPEHSQPGTPAQRTLIDVGAMTAVVGAPVETGQTPAVGQTSAAGSESKISTEARYNLDSLLGSRKLAAPSVSPADDSAQLQQMVGHALASTPQVAYAPRSAGKNGKNGSKDSKNRTWLARAGRRDWLTIIFVVLGIAALIVAGSVVGVRMSQVTPTSGAIELLEMEEESLHSAEGIFAAGTKTLQNNLAEALEEAAALRTAVVTAQPVSNAQASESMLSAIGAFEKNVAAIKIPKAPPIYTRGSVDTTSLQAISKATDQVADAAGVLSQAQTQLLAADAQLDVELTQLNAAVTTFAGTFPAQTTLALEAAPLAAEEFVAAVNTASQSLADSRTSTALISALTPYQVALAALAGDQVRAAEQAELEANRGGGSGGGGGNSGGGGGGSGGGDSGGNIETETPVDPGPGPEPEPEPEPEPTPEEP